MNCSPELFAAAVPLFAVAVVLCVAKPGKELPLEFAYSPSTQIDRLKAGWGAGAQDRGCWPWPPSWGVAVMSSVGRGRGKAIRPLDLNGRPRLYHA
jgi:hypothetical protein